MTDPPPGKPPADPRDSLIREQAERVREQDRRFAAQAEQIAALEAMVADLRGQLAAAERAGSRNSGNSSMPPSSDDLPGRKPPRRQRRAAERAENKRKRGKQPGSPGASIVTGALASDGFIHSCPAKAASLAADVVRLIRALITAAPVAGFDETTLRSGPAGDKKYIHGAFTERYPALWLGTRSLEAMADAGILPDLAGIVVSGRYQNYFHPRWKHVAGNQACLSHLLRDFEDCAETYPGAIWPGQAQQALRGMIHAWHAACEQGLPAIPADALSSLEHEFRHAVLAGLASVPRVPEPKHSTKQRPGRELLEFCKDRQGDALRFTTGTSIWPTNNISERGVRPLKTQQKASGRLPATTSPRTASTSAATSTPPASTARTLWMSCTTSCSAGPGGHPQPLSPHSHQPETALPITTREWAECLPSELPIMRRIS